MNHSAYWVLIRGLRRITDDKTRNDAVYHVALELRASKVKEFLTAPTLFFVETACPEIAWRRYDATPNN